MTFIANNDRGRDNWDDFIVTANPSSYELSPPSLFNVMSDDNELLKYFLRSVSASKRDVPQQGIHIATGAYVSDLTFVYDKNGTIYDESTIDHDQTFSFDEIQSLCGGDIGHESEGAFIFKAGKNNFGHMLVEMLPKLELMKSCGLDGTCILVPLIPDALKNILEYVIHAVYDGVFPIRYLSTPLTKVDKLYYPSAVTRHNNQKSEAVLRFAERVSSRVSEDSHTASRIYVSRRTFLNRRLIEENEIERIFENEGFTIVNVEHLSFADQIRAFRQAEIVAGPMGAALSSIVFSPPGTKVIMLDPGSHDMFFYDLACLKKQSFAWIFASGLIRSNHKLLHDPWSLRPDIVRAALRSIV